MSESVTSNPLLHQLEAKITKRKNLPCAQNYPHPGYVCDFDPTCDTCLIVAAALELRKATPVETPGEPDFPGLLREMWTFWGRPREQEFTDAGISVAKGMDLYERVSAALGDPLCAKCDRRFSQHKTVISHDFMHRPAVEPSPEPPGLICNKCGVDRFKATCPNRFVDCPMHGTAQQVNGEQKHD